jgi:hypothetical protein
MLKELSVGVLMSMSAVAAVRIEKIDFKGWPNSYRMTNGEVELVVTGDVGPRIIRYAFVGGQNIFKEYPEQIGKKGEREWQIRGGHRLWVGPEVPPPSPITYALDNFPVNIVIKGDTIEATPPLEREAGLQKQIVVKLAASGTAVEVTHRITNKNAKPMALAAWALTVMAAGGVGIHGLPPRGTHPEMLTPTNPLVMWAFTDLSDKRWQFTQKYILLRQDPKAPRPQKIGSFNKNTFGAYYLGSELFMKRYTADPGKTYPDMGSSFETFTNADMLESETMGPLTTLAPGATVEHVERWTLHKNVKIGSFTDAELDRIVLPLVGK